MHHIMMMIVEATSKREALRKAKSLMETMSGSSIDYGTFFDEKGHGIAGKDRWGPMEPVVKLQSKKGAEYLLHALEAMYDEFLDNIKEVKIKIDRPNEALFLDRHFLLKCKWVYDSQWLYHDGMSLHLEDLNQLLADERPDDLYIVPVDVHT